MNAKKTFVMLGLMSALSVGALVAQPAPVHITSSVEGLGVPVLAISVDTPQSILDWFETHGMDVDSVGNTLNSMPIPYRNELRKLYADDLYSKELQYLAAAALKPYLKPGIVETVTTSYGPFTWTVAYGPNNDDEYNVNRERLYASHKHDRNSD